MGLSCDGRTGGPHGRGSTEVGRATGVQYGVQATAVQRILTGEKTVAELSRELDIAPSVIRNWKRFAEAGATTAVQASEDVVPASHLREAYAKIRELERLLGKKQMEIEILQAAQDVVKKSPWLRKGSGR
jgi:transposase